MSPRQAVAWAAFFNFAAFLVFGTSVAQTIGTGLIDMSIVTPIVVLAGLVGAIAWNVLTWLLGLPTSSSHALIGAYAGAAFAKAGPGILIAPGWVKMAVFLVLASYAALALGTLAGGWQIVKTMGQKITKLQPVDGFCAETASAASIFLATFLGAPISTTHVITGAIAGLGATRRFSAVRWGVTVRIVWAWILTIPAAGLAGAALYALLRLVLGSSV